MTIARTRFLIALARQIEQAATAADPAEPEPVAVLEFEPPDAPLVTAPSASADAAPQEASADGAMADATSEVTPGGFVDLGAELAHELDARDQPASADAGGPLVDGLLKELRKGVREQLDEMDYETHYNLGIAYKEMELYDEAIQEFRLTAREPNARRNALISWGCATWPKGNRSRPSRNCRPALRSKGIRRRRIITSGRDHSR